MQEPQLAIRGIELFSSLTDEEAKSVLEAGKMETYGPGHELARQGETARELLVLLAGTVRTSRADDPAGSETHSADARPIVLGQVGLFRDASRNASVVTQTTSTVFRLSRDQFESLLQAEAVGAYKVALVLGRYLAERVCSLTEGFRTLCNCCQDTAKEEDLTAFRKQLLTEWNL